MDVARLCNELLQSIQNSSESPWMKNVVVRARCLRRVALKCLTASDGPGFKSEAAIPKDESEKGAGVAGSTVSIIHVSLA